MLNLPSFFLPVVLIRDVEVVISSTTSASASTLIASASTNKKMRKRPLTLADYRPSMKNAMVLVKGRSAPVIIAGPLIHPDFLKTTQV